MGADSGARGDDRPCPVCGRYRSSRAMMQHVVSHLPEVRAEKAEQGRRGSGGGKGNAPWWKKLLNRRMGL